MLKKGAKNYFLWEGCDSGAGKEHEEEGTAQMKCYKLTAVPISCFPLPLWERGGGRRVRNKKVNLSP